MKIYQLMACGYFAINHARYTTYSAEVYRSQKQARAALPAFYKYMTTAKRVGDTMIMNKKDIRILIHPLTLVDDKTKTKTKEIER